MIDRMDVRDRIILPLRPPGEIEGAGASDLLLHLLLFDTVILPSRGLADLALLASTLGVPDTIDLLKTGLIKIHSEIDLIARNDNEPSVVSLLYLNSNEPSTILSQHLQRLRRIEGARHRDIKNLKLAVVAAWLRPDPERLKADGLEAIALAERDLALCSPTFMTALAVALRREGIEEPATPDRVAVSQVDGSRFRVKIKGVPGDGVAAARIATGALADLNRMLAQMRRDQAIRTLADDSLEILESRLDSLVLALPDANRVPNFRRVVGVSGLPDFSEALADRRINLERLLHVRASAECRQLREWLNKSSAGTDTEIRDAVSGLKARLGNLYGSTAGKAFRILVATAIGLASTGAGVAAGTIDTFVLDRFFRTPGAVTFLRRDYPSLFYDK